MPKTHCAVGFSCKKLQLNALKFCVHYQPGSFRSTQNETCQLCSKGTFQSNYGKHSCKLADFGNYVAEEGATSQKMCPTTRKTTGSFKCPDCPAGYRYTEERCVTCEKGFFSSTKNAEKCQICPAGGHTSLDRTSCLICQRGFFSAEPTWKECERCPSGEYADTVGSTVCKKCPAGSFQSLTGQSNCDQCPDGTYAEEEGSVICKPCPLGKTSDSGRTQWPLKILIFQCIKKNI